MNRVGFEAVILDMDGVITQTARVHARAWKQMFDEYFDQREGAVGDKLQPFDIDSDYRRHVDGKPRYDGVQSVLASRGIELSWGAEDDAPGAETVCGLGNRKNEIFHESLERDGVEVYEDSIEQIERWKRAGLKIAVLTSSRNGEAVLRAASLLDRFEVKVDGNDIAREGLEGKPSPGAFLLAAQRLGVEPGETIVVEDAIAGVQAGRAGDFGLVVGVARTRDDVDLRAAGADCVVRDLRELDAMNRDAPSVEAGTSPPSAALEYLDSIASRLEGKQLALFLDYDGTLTPIVRRPEDATLSNTMRSLISQLAQHASVAVVSGRDRRDVEKMVRIDNVVYAGSHGFDIRGPGGVEMEQDDARQALSDLDAAERKLRSRLDSVAGVNVERKKFAIAVHYREVSSDEDVRQVENAVDDMLGEHSNLRKRGGKKIFELQPDVEWDKGRAVLWLAETLGLRHSGVVLIYIGDDETDEDAFRVLRDRDTDFGIRVAAPDSPTEAAYYLRNCDEVEQFLNWLLSQVRRKKS